MRCVFMYFYWCIFTVRNVSFTVIIPDSIMLLDVSTWNFLPLPLVPLLPLCLLFPCQVCTPPNVVLCRIQDPQARQSTYLHFWMWLILFNMMLNMIRGRQDGLVGKDACCENLLTWVQSLDPHKGGSENWLHRIVLWPPHGHHVTCALAPTIMNTFFKKITIVKIKPTRANFTCQLKTALSHLDRNLNPDQVGLWTYL